MFKPFTLAALAVLAAISANSVMAAENGAANKNAATGNVAVTVNGKAIPAARLELRVKAAEQQGQADSPELRSAIKDDLINLEVISQEANKKGLDAQTDVAQQLELAKQTVLAGAYVQDYVKTHPITDAAIKQEYENLKSHLGDKEYKASHILVKTEKEANDVAAMLKKKSANFGKIAKEKSIDPGSKDKGGDLGWAVPSNFVPSFGEALKVLAKGEISAPIQTQYGWHIIKLEDTRALKAPDLDSVKHNLERHLQQQAIKDAIKELRANAEIK